MKNTKKLLSLFLAVVMLVSMFTVMASAIHTSGAEKAGDINYKFTVEKVSSTPADDDNGIPSYEGDDIYAVSLWMQSDEAVSFIQVPVHFNKEHFSPIMLYDGEDLYVGNDTYVTDMGEAACYVRSYGDFMNNTGAYKADGSKATTKALAKCIGIGHPSWGTNPQTDIQYMAPDHDLYNVWHKTLQDNQGAMKVQIIVNTVKSAYFNCISGIDVDTNWNKMITIYFQRNEGVKDADVVGDVFGVTTPDCFGVDGVHDLNKGYYESATAAIVANPTKNIVGNAVVGGTVTPATPLTVVKWKDQIKFDTNKDGSYKGTFSYRTLADLNNFYEIFDDVADAVDTADGDGILDAGFVFNKGAALDIAAAKAQVEGGDAVYTQTQNTYLSTTMKDGSVVMACVVYGINDADAATALSTLAYVKYMQDGEVKYAYYDVETGTFEGLYNEHYSEAFAG